MEFMCLLILTLLTVEAVPMMRLNIQENVNFGYPINTPMYYYVPYVSPYYSLHQLINPDVFALNAPSGMESKLSLSDKTLGLFSTTDDDSVHIYAYPFQEFLNRLFSGGIFRLIRFWIKGFKPVNTASVPTVINNSGVSSALVVIDDENEAVIIEAEGYQLLK
ncbi:hypothetical protein DAPPUDRAFT_303657 [Daphnia pulex]|uniref:Uncharacterized protein n=1 Tax=Daphnia pulex TaxID=6669 RepID=E9GHK5_DAPPU|nr:hypothetical protein DAPPUDRAFT_303657 [Daphnia pulex]|eukprot:EFX81040.1 hypothetical protein DAPPUDRAFT_303657 [Daphnia pulex]